MTTYVVMLSRFYEHPDEARMVKRSLEEFEGFLNGQLAYWVAVGDLVSVQTFSDESVVMLVMRGADPRKHPR